jgi:membrane-bound serine protease (ClpP class)
MGGICLILGLIGLQTLSLNYAGLLLLVLGLVLFFLETQFTSHGVLSLGGAVALLAGSLLLFDSPEPFLRVSLKVALPTVLLSVAFFVFAVTLALRAQRRHVVSGKEGLLGQHGRVRRVLAPRGTVFVAGEHWTAVSATGETIPDGVTVEVISLDHLELTVRRVED